MKTRNLRNHRPRGVNLRATQPALKRSRSAGPNRSSKGPVKLRRILVPTDFSKPSIKAIRYAVRFAEQSGATILLVYVFEPFTFIHDLENFPLAIPEMELARLAKEKLVGVATSEIEKLASVKVEVRFGKPFREIASMASETDADLIVIATHGHTGINRMLLGSTAELVVRHAPCPVLVVRDHGREFVQPKRPGNERRSESP